MCTFTHTYTSTFTAHSSTLNPHTHPNIFLPKIHRGGEKARCRFDVNCVCVDISELGVGEGEGGVDKYSNASDRLLSSICRWIFLKYRSMVMVYYTLCSSLVVGYNNDNDADGCSERVWVGVCVLKDIFDRVTGQVNRGRVLDGN